MYTTSEIREIARALFSVRTLDRWEYQVLLIREGLPAIPIILDEAMRHGDQLKSIGRKAAPNVNWQKVPLKMSIPMAIIMKGEIVDLSYSIISGKGTEAEEILQDEFINGDMGLKLFILLIFLKFQSLSFETQNFLLYTMKYYGERKDQLFCSLIALILENFAEPERKIHLAKIFRPEGETYEEACEFWTGKALIKLFF